MKFAATTLAASRHVLHHDDGLSGDVPRQVLGQEARADVVVAADRMAADQPDLLAAIEIGLGGRASAAPGTPAASAATNTSKLNCARAMPCLRASHNSK